MLHPSNITWWNNFAAVKIKETAVQKWIWNTSKIGKQFITSNIWFMFHWVGLANIRVLRLHNMDQLDSIFNQLLLLYPEKRHYKSKLIKIILNTASCGRRDGLMVSVLVPGVNGPVVSPGQRHCVVFLGKTLNSYSSFRAPPRSIIRYWWIVGETWQIAGELPMMSLPSCPGGEEILLSTLCYRNLDKLWHLWPGRLLERFTFLWSLP